MFDSLKTYEFLMSIGLVTFCASVVTLILTSIVKFILKKAKVINNNTEPVKKDIILSRVGRVIGIISYAGFYVINVIFIEKASIVIDVKLITSLLSGGTLTLIVSKGIYTMIRQMEKKNTVYEKLEVAEETITKLEKEIVELGLCEEKKETNENQTNSISRNKKWIIKGE